MRVNFGNFSSFNAFGDEPPQLDTSTFMGWIRDGAIPDAVVQSICNRLIENETDLRATYAMLDAAWTAIQAQDTSVPQEYFDAQTQYRQLWAEHQIHKFYAFLVPQFHDMLLLAAVEPV